MLNTLTRIWKGKQTFELFSLESHCNQKIAGGIVRGLINNQTVEMKYQVTLDKWWKVRFVKISLLARPYKFLVLSSDYYGRWFNQSNRHLSDLDGCIDIDISATPFTNTLPIRRLDQQLTESQQLKVVYIRVPELEVLPVMQRYTRLSDSKFRYENISSGFCGELTVDEQGLVLDYPDLFEAVYIQS